MARKKTVPIARKPTAAQAGETGASAETLPPSLPVTLEAARPELPRRPPAPGRGLVGGAVYGLAFRLSYGVVFSALLVGQFIPGGRLIGEALQNGAGAAKRDFEHLKGRGGAGAAARIVRPDCSP